MTTLQFTLQPALTHKKRLEEICQMELAEIEVTYEQERRVLDLLAQTERLGYQELQTQQEPGELDIGLINIYMYDLQTLQRRIEEQLALLEIIAENSRLKREELIEVSKDKKALEKLKEKHLKDIAQTMTRAENKVMEDIATSQFHRRKVGQALI